MRERWEFSENFEIFFLGRIYHLSKMSLQATIVSGWLRTELCPWGVNHRIKINHVP